MSNNPSTQRNVKWASLKLRHALLGVAIAVVAVLLGSSAALCRLVPVASASSRRTSPVLRERSF